MRPGTPGFQGSRLREAREVRALTAVTLSELAEVTPQSISHYEHGRTTPGPEMLGRLARALRVPEQFFTMPERPETDSTTYYRSLSSATKAARSRAQGRCRWRQDVVSYLAEFVEFPPLNLPRVDAPSDPALIGSADVEEAAEQARRHWNTGALPISNVAALLENQGVIVARDVLGAQSLDSLSQLARTDGRAYVVLGIDKGTAVRWRFDAAHELGHLLLHSSLDQRKLSNAAEFRRIEEQAHLFAGAFLLPAAEFAEDFFAANLDALRAIKPKWKVSIGVMIKRARALNLVTDEAERRLWINYSRHKWRRFEPYDDVLPVEEPTVLRQAMQLLMDSGDQTPYDLSTRLGLPLSDIEVLCGIEAGYLSGSFAKVSVLSRSSEDNKGDLETNASVIDLTRRFDSARERE